VEENHAKRNGTELTNPFTRKTAVKTLIITLFVENSRAVIKTQD